MMGEVWGYRDENLWELVLPTQFCCEPKAAIKKKLINLKRRGYHNNLKQFNVRKSINLTHLIKGRKMGQWGKKFTLLSQ